ncbi:MAG: T9SS type A sorting domain-containing protein [Bacteroidales bacterium]
MRKTVLLALLILFMSTGYAQNVKNDSIKDNWEWAPVGAKWFYSQNLLNPDYITYTYIESTKDTIIHDTTCKKLVEYRYDMSNNERVIHTQFFMFKNNSKVYYYSSEKNRFCLLYDFSKQAGEYWILDEFPYSDEDGFDNRVYVDSISNCTINGENRVIQFIHMEDQALCFGNDTIIEGIGNLNYMFPFCELSDIGPLRCYEDDSLGNYQVTGTQDCTYQYLAVDAYNTKSNEYSIYPNPTQDIIKVNWSDNKSRKIEIVNSMGKMVFCNKNTESGNVHDLSGLPAGLYLLKINNEVQTIVKK